jgi:hypothetical protein
MSRMLDDAQMMVRGEVPRRPASIWACTSGKMFSKVALAAARSL